MLIVISQDSESSCYDEKNCPMSNPPAMPFGFTKTGTIQNPSQSNTHPEMRGAGESICLSTVPTKRKNVMQCFKEEYVVCP